MDSSPIIQLKQVTKSFRVKTQEIKVLQGIDIEIYSGEFVVILGPSGSGKSTILNLILGLEPRTTGEIFLKGESIHDKSSDYIAELRKKYIGMVHQQANWIRSLSVLENVAFPLTLRNMPKHKTLNEAYEKLKIFDMEDWGKFLPSELSSGQQQKVGLARALVTNPEIIVADEPTGNLDYKSGRRLVNLLSNLSKEGKTIIMVTHDLEYIEFADRIIRILDGRVFEEINKKKGQDINKLKQKIVTEAVEAEKLYNSTENIIPVPSDKKKTKDPIKKIITSFQSFRFRNLVSLLFQFIQSVGSVLLTLLIAIISIFYRIIDVVLGLRFWPIIVKNYRFRLSNIYYKVTNLFEAQRKESVNFVDLIDLSIRNLMSKKMRTYVTVGGVALGIAFTVFLISLGFGLEKIVLQNFTTSNKLRTIDVFSSINHDLVISDESLVDFSNLPGVENVFPVIGIAGKVNLQGSETDIVVYGIEQEYLYKSDLNLISGTFSQDTTSWQLKNIMGDSDDATQNIDNTRTKSLKKVVVPSTGEQNVVVNKPFLELFSLEDQESIGKKFDVSLVVTQELSSSEEDIESYPIEYKISAVISNFDIPIIYIPIQDIKSLGITNYSQARVILKSQEQVNQSREKIDIMGYRTESVLDTITQIETTFRNIRRVLTLVGMVALTVASFGMFNTLTVSLLERVREIGLLKVMGMRSIEIRDLFLSEAILLGLIGGVLGIGIGILSGSLVSSIISYIAIHRGYEAIEVVSVPTPSLLAILLVAILTGMLTGLYPSRRATKISALDALRYE